MNSETAFAADVRNVIQSSQRAARRLGHDSIDVEHVLLGIIAESESTAAELLQRLGCDFSELKRAAENAIQPSDKVVSETGRGGTPLTKETERVLRNTYVEADETGREEIGTEHILLSLLHEEEVARMLNRTCGITYERVRAEL